MRAWTTLSPERSASSAGATSHRKKNDQPLLNGRDGHETFEPALHFDLDVVGRDTDDVHVMPLVHLGHVLRPSIRLGVDRRISGQDELLLDRSYQFHDGSGNVADYAILQPDPQVVSRRAGYLDVLAGVDPADFLAQSARPRVDVTIF